MKAHRAVERRPHPPRPSSHGPDDPRGIDLLHLRRERRRRRPEQRALRARHALPLELRADASTASVPLLLSSGQGRVLLGGLLPAQPDGRRSAAGLALDRRASASSATGCRSRSCSRTSRRSRLPSTSSSQIGCDFADIFAVKQYDFALGDPRDATPLPPLGARSSIRPADELARSSTATGATRRTQLHLSQPGERATAARVRWHVELEPRARGSSRRRRRLARRHPRRAGSRSRGASARSAPRPRLARGLAAAGAAACALLGRPRSRFHSPIADLASLRMRAGPATASARLPAAGMPWFMTVFGRDTLITCLQTLLFGPELARSALEALAELQATEDDPSIDAEPGKIVHELRRARRPRNWFARYYGTVDATPLYLILLSEVWRWTGDDALVARSARARAARARRGSTSYGDRDGDGFVEYERRVPSRAREPVLEGLLGLAALLATARSRRTPIAPVEVQGYVYDAKLRMAELAREVWRERELAERLEREAAELQRALRRGVLGRRSAAATTRSRSTATSGRSTRSAPTSATCSGAGSSRRPRVDAVVDALMGDAPLVGLGRAHDVQRGRRLQPALVPQRHRLAPRQLPDRRGASPAAGAGARRRSGSSAGCIDVGRPLRVPAARGLRRAPARGDAVPDRLPDRRAAAGVGRRHAGAPAPDPARASSPTARPPGCWSARPARAPVLGRRHAALRRARLRPRTGTSRSGRARRSMEG